MNKKSVLMGVALAGLMMGSTAHADNHKGENNEVMCYGVNSCKGHGSCAGKIDACSGKNGCEAKLKCAGHNSCKGKGLTKMKKKECLSKGGKVAS